MHPWVGLQLSGNTLTPLHELGPGKGHLGRPMWNPREMLSDLELRLGLPRPELARGLRVQRWSQRLAALMANSSRPAPYFAAAYTADPTGTAAQLLRLRDELVDAGWNGEPLLGAERLETLHRLSALEGPPLPPGLPDQLAAVEAELAQATRSPYVALSLVDELDLWPGRWRRVLQRLQALGARLEHVRPSWPSFSGESDLARFQHALREGRVEEVSPPAADGSLVVLRGATSSLLAEPTAALLAADRAHSTVVIRGVDPGPFDAALELQGLARQGVVSRSRWRPALQVLRLALTVGFVPRDPRRRTPPDAGADYPRCTSEKSCASTRHSRCGAVARSTGVRSATPSMGSWRRLLERMKNGSAWSALGACLRRVPRGRALTLRRSCK